MSQPISQPDRFGAILSLVGGNLAGGSDGSNMNYCSGQTPPTEGEIDTEFNRLQALYDAQAYVRNRQDEYPDTATQFEKIYDDGLTKWKSEMVDPVKTKWPKDNSGPV